MRERRTKNRQKQYARLLRQLRTAVGVSGAAYVSVAGYCAPCPSSYSVRSQRCDAPGTIDQWREESGDRATGLCPDLTEYARYARDRSLPAPLYLVRKEDLEGHAGAGSDAWTDGTEAEATRPDWAGPYGTGSDDAGSDGARPDWAGPDGTGLDDAGSGEAGVGGAGVGGAGVGGAGVGGAGVGEIGSDGAKQCCYEFIGTATDYHCPGGRPFLIDGQARVGKLQVGALGGSSARTTALASAWRADALMEHASVAAFARLTLELLQHAAPLDLIADAQAASLDELRHAHTCRRRGAELANAAWSFGPLATEDSLNDLSLPGLLERNIIEGCIGETIAACVMRERAASAADPNLKRELEQIAEDETRHAALAFRILNWALQAHPALRAEAVRIFQGELARLQALAIPTEHDAIVGTTHGHIPARVADAVRRDVCVHVLHPLVRDLEHRGRNGRVDEGLATHPA